MTSMSVAAPSSTTKEAPVILYLVNTMKRLNMDTLTFFRVAHIYRFATDPDLTGDVSQFQKTGTVPIYVREYLKVLQEQ